MDQRAFSRFALIAGEGARVPSDRHQIATRSALVGID
jgi:hypothetical protein